MRINWISGVILSIVISLCFAIGLALADDSAVETASPTRSDITFTLLDNITSDNGEVLTQQLCARITGENHMLKVNALDIDTIKHVALFEQTTKPQLLGVIKQLRNLINAGNDTRKALNNVADLYTRREEINNELNEIEKLVKVFFDDG